MHKQICFETRTMPSNEGGTIKIPIYRGVLDRNALPPVLIDEMTLEFHDTSIPSTLAHVIRRIWPNRFSRRWQKYECNDFVAMMLGQDPGRDNPFEATSERVESDDISITSPVVLSVKFRDIEPIPVHTLYPAHADGEALYLHKLGDKGPLCLSSLDDAKRLLGARLATTAVLSNPQ